MKKEIDKLPIVFVTTFTEDTQVNTVQPLSRQEQLDGCTDKKTKQQKYVAWKLLQYGVQKVFGKDLQQFAPTKQDNGKWTASGLCFSISHSDNVVCVAIDDSPIGVDVETYQTNRFDDKLIAKVFCDNEKQASCTHQDYYVAWCKKEAIFKFGNEKVFAPQQIDTTITPCLGQSIVVDGNSCALAICTSKQNYTLVNVDKKW